MNFKGIVWVEFHENPKETQSQTKRLREQTLNVLLYVNSIDVFVTKQNNNKKK